MNKSHYINFFIDDRSKIVIPLEDPVKLLNPSYEENILFFHDKHKDFLSQSTIYHDIMKLAVLLKHALSNNLQIDSSIDQNIGYQIHQYHFDETKVTQCFFSNGVYSWVGYKYKLWEATENNLCLISWIYNQPDGSIVFEITPFYPYMYCEPEEEPDYISYEKWIKTYKPYFITTLSRKTAVEWLEQAKRIIKIIEDNQKRWDNLSKKDFEN